MNNPWLKIPASDYEGHMAKAGQLQVLNTLTKELLKIIQPSTFALLGCCTGNGLEHINPEKTKAVYAVDINPQYLEICRTRYSPIIPGLKTILIDIGEKKIPIREVDFCFAGLILEYVDPQVALSHTTPILKPGGFLTIVIQQTGPTKFVSETGFKSLQKLSQISNEIDEKKLDIWVRNNEMKPVARREVKLADSKSFVVLS